MPLLLEEHHIDQISHLAALDEGAELVHEDLGRRVGDDAVALELGEVLLRHSPDEVPARPPAWRRAAW